MARSTVAERPPGDVLQLFDAAEMMALAVKLGVGSVRNNEPELCVRYYCSVS
jgi:hypothetical protein